LNFLLPKLVLDLAENVGVEASQNFDAEACFNLEFLDSVSCRRALLEVDRYRVSLDGRENRDDKVQD
jgi:hypothetical protein